MNIEKFESEIQHGFEERRVGDLIYYVIPSIEATGSFVYGFTARQGGVSPGAFSSLNLSKTREKAPDNKSENYNRCSKALGFTAQSMVLVNYAHGDGICCIGPEDCGKGFERENDLPFCDALALHEPGVTAVTLHADCVPVVMVDPEKRAGIIAHAGWKGTIKRLPEKMVRFLSTEFGSREQNILVGIGPHIQECCFEVGDDVGEAFEQEFGSEVVTKKKGEKPHVRLQRAILKQLMETGIAPSQVTVSDLCTYCEQNLFYSHRRDQGLTGAMGSFLYIQER